MLADNSVTLTAYRPKAALRIAELAESKQVFLGDALDLSLDLLALKEQDTETLSLTLISMMVVCGMTYQPDGLSRGFMSYRSHAEYFFAAYDGDGQIRKKFDQIEVSMGRKVNAIVKAIDVNRIDTLPLPKAHCEIIARWAHVVSQTARRNEEIVRTHHEALKVDTTFDDLVRTVSVSVPEDFQAKSQAREVSQLGKAFEHEEGLRLRSSVEFMAYRTTVNFFYLLLPTLGVSPVQKFCFCHLLANAAERHFGISWQEIVGLDPASSV